MRKHGTSDQEYIVHCGCGCLCHTFIELSLCGSHYFSDSVCTEVYEVGYSPSDYLLFGVM